MGNTEEVKPNITTNAGQPAGTNNNQGDNNTMQTQEPKTLIAAINRLAAALEEQNKILNDVVSYPADMRQPARLLVEDISRYMAPDED